MKALGYLTGALAALYLILTVFVGFFLLVIASIIVRPFSRVTFLKFGNFVQVTYLSQLVYFFEAHHSNVHFYVSGDEVPPGESALLTPNHQNHDYIILYSYAFRNGRLGNVRTFLKGIFKWLPGFGWSMWLFGWPFLSRSWEKDEIYMKNLFQKYKEDNLPLWLWIFPEGTRITPAKLKSSQEYAKTKGYPVYKNVMLPRPKGFTSIVKTLDGIITCVYDVTIAYSGWGDRFPDPQDMFFLDPEKEYGLHLHVKRYEIKDLPKGEEELSQWLRDSFEKKDALLEEFKKNGRFPGPVINLPQPKGQFTMPFVLYSSLLVLSFVLAGYFFL